jgi:hypothetical protein
MSYFRSSGRIRQALPAGLSRTRHPRKSCEFRALALALPVPTGQQLPASLQLIGGPNAEALLLDTGIGLSGGLPGRSQ